MNGTGLENRNPSPRQRFWGCHHGKILDGGRIRVPKEVVAGLGHPGTGLVIVAPMFPEPALVLCPETEWPRWRAAALAKVPQEQRETALRTLFAQAKPTRFGNKGRTYFPKPLRTYAGLHEPVEAKDAGVVFVAAGNVWEVWAKGRWDGLLATVAQVRTRSTQTAIAVVTKGRSTAPLVAGKSRRVAPASP